MTSLISIRYYCKAICKINLSCYSFIIINWFKTLGSTDSNSWSIKTELERERERDRDNWVYRILCLQFTLQLEWELKLELELTRWVSNPFWNFLVTLQWNLQGKSIWSQSHSQCELNPIVPVPVLFPVPFKLCLNRPSMLNCHIWPTKLKDRIILPR